MIGRALFTVYKKLNFVLIRDFQYNIWDNKTWNVRIREIIYTCYRRVYNNITVIIFNYNICIRCTSAYIVLYTYCPRFGILYIYIGEPLKQKILVYASLYRSCEVMFAFIEELPVPFDPLFWFNVTIGNHHPISSSSNHPKPTPYMVLQ